MIFPKYLIALFLLVPFQAAAQRPVEIILINIENLDRGDIGKEIAIVNALAPRVIGIDIRFDTHNNDDKDLALHKALSAVDSVKTMKFVKDHEQIIDIDCHQGKMKFKKFSAEDVLSEKISRNDVEGNVVLLGFLGTGDEDKFYTPLNAQGHEPNVYGVEMIANVIAQVLGN